MSEPRFPDAARSRALLIGVGEFAAAPDLPQIPAVSANLADLWQVLTNPHTGTFDPAHSAVLANPAQSGEIGNALNLAASTATDLLLVYYAGHGIVDERGRLYLTLPNTDRGQVRWTAIPFELLREEIANSAAAVKVLVLDCCFSGRAIEAMGNQESVVTGQLEVAGTYTLTATPANAPAYAPTGERHTAFTGALLTALTSPGPLTLDQIYTQVDRELAARNLTRPQRKVTNTGGHLVLSRGSGCPVSQMDPVVLPQAEVVRFGRRVTDTNFLLRTLGEFVRDFVQVVLSVLLLTSGLFAAFIVGLGLFMSFDSDHVNFGLVTLISCGLLALGIPLFLFRGRPTGPVRELLVDHAGLTAGLLPYVHIPWQDVAAVGILRLGRRAFVRRLASRKVRYVLVVRLRPAAPMPPMYNVLSERYGTLGYLGICMLDDLKTTSDHANEALARFAGSRFFLHPRQFLDHDPRLRPDMI